MRYYAVIDTNVLISALLSSHEDAATVQVVSKLFSGEIIPLYSAEIIHEYGDVLRRKKFAFTPQLTENMLKTIERAGIWVSPSPIEETLPDMKDMPFYEVVMEKQDDGAYLVTGNTRHFPQKRFIVTAKEMLEIIQKGK